MQKGKVLIYIIYAKVDQNWAKQKSPDPNVPPQTHLSNIRINNNYKIMEKLKKEFPGRIYECDFKNLIYNTEDEMKKISKFLDIPYENILSKPTHFGESIKFKNGDGILNKEKYTAESTFTKYQIELINQFDKKFPKYNFLSLSFLDFIFIKSFYLIKLFLRNTIKFLHKN